MLIAPVLDSRESLLFMYPGKTIDEFVNILCAYVQDNTLARKVPADNKWFEADLWKAPHDRK